MTKTWLTRFKGWLLPLSTACIITAIAVRIFTAVSIPPVNTIPVSYPVSAKATPDTQDDEVAPAAYAWLADPPLEFTRPNRSGPEVVALQERLQELGFLRGKADGIYGLATLTAVKRFQVKHMLVPDGKVDEATSRQLADPQDTFSPGKRPPSPPSHVVVSIPERTLTVHLTDGSEYVFPCTVGDPRTPTPTGEYRVTNKGYWEGQFGGYWLGLNVRYGWYGIHGTNQPWSVGEAQSEGCVRLLNEYASIVFDWLPIGTPVRIHGLPSGRLLMDGSRGSDVRLVQQKLITAGYLNGGADGVFGPATVQAVIRMQKKHGLYPNGRFTPEMYPLLDIETDPEQGTPSAAAIRNS